MAAYASESESVSSDYSSDEETGLKATNINLRSILSSSVGDGQVSWFIITVSLDCFVICLSSGLQV